MDILKANSDMFSVCFQKNLHIDLPFFLSHQRCFKKYQQKPILKELHASETKGLLFIDQMPLNALYKVRTSQELRLGHKAFRAL